MFCSLGVVNYNIHAIGESMIFFVHFRRLDSEYDGKNGTWTWESWGKVLYIVWRNGLRNFATPLPLVVEDRNLIRGACIPYTGCPWHSPFGLRDTFRIATSCHYQRGSVFRIYMEANLIGTKCTYVLNQARLRKIRSLHVHVRFQYPHSSPRFWEPNDQSLSGIARFSTMRWQPASTVSCCRHAHKLESSNLKSMYFP